MESGLPALESRVHWRSTLARMSCCFSGATNRLEYNLLPNSCEGEPAPSLAPAAALASELGVLEVDIGNRREFPEDGGSAGEVEVVDEAEGGAWDVSWGM